MKVSLNIEDCLLLCLTFQGLVLSGLLFHSSKKVKSNRWLAAFIFILSYCTLSMLVLSSGIPNKYPWIYFVLPQLRLALGPLLYFYTRGLLADKQRLSLRDYLHLAPLVFELGPQIALLVHGSGLMSIPAFKGWYLPFENLAMEFTASNPAELPFFFSFLIYSLVCYKMVAQGKGIQELSPYKVKDIYWLQKLLIVALSIIATWLITIVLNYFALPQLVYPTRFVTALMAIGFAYWLGMAAYARQAKMSVTDVLEYHKPAVKVYFSADEATLYQTQLLALMETDQLYLNPALKLDVLAKKMALSEKQLSNLLNQHVDKSFNDFVNEYRVLEAKRKLADTRFSQFTIASIAFDCGFNSLATFQRCFKQFTGITPSQYQNQ